MAMYTVHTTPPKDGSVGYVNNCNCTHFLQNKSACKHISAPGLGRTPSTSGLPSGSYCYAPMVPAPLPYQLNIENPQQPQRSGLHSGTPPRAVKPPTSHPGASATSDRWLPESSHLTTGLTDPSSDSYIERLFYNPHHLQSTPPPHHAGPYVGHPLSQNAVPYPNSPFLREVARNPQCGPAPPLPATSSSHFMNHSATSNTRTSHGASSSSSFTPRRHYYSLTENDVPDLAPPPPPPTQMTYHLDPQSLFRALNQHVPPPVPQALQRTPEVTPAPPRYRNLTPPGPRATTERPAAPVPGANLPGAPATKSMYDGFPFIQNMLPSAAQPANACHSMQSTHRTETNDRHVAHTTTDSSVSRSTTSHHASTSSHRLETTRSHGSTDTGPFVLTVAKEDALRAVESRNFKRKDDFAGLCTALRRISAEAPYEAKDTALSTYNEQLVAAIRKEAETFLARLRNFNGGNRPKKQRRF
ncbi:uncharacterized protein MELLADRAFT_109954 [Melampsora larici-populina 98AG31]|uniref:SWIM-type domain-containing protein n=1 Tax=Melampsora larici-populina (strain 98AG31 / pathotype 3-4-7) TaxID=747676 RepID=F4RY61_MELLP|nr:uncharacterized protein MELLADRAFT_109954 [Melampsora larici-populina 98AG31]EGG02698.1 hypothetical protein MELLADRAFT_109954 [Melampsora larici-populina 98AG31]